MIRMIRMVPRDIFSMQWCIRPLSQHLMLSMFLIIVINIIMKMILIKVIKIVPSDIDFEDDDGTDDDDDDILATTLKRTSLSPILS